MALFTDVHEDVPQVPNTCLALELPWFWFRVPPTFFSAQVKRSWYAHRQSVARPLFFEGMD